MLDQQRLRFLRTIEDMTYRYLDAAFTVLASMRLRRLASTTV